MLRGVRRVLQTRLNACPRRPAGDKPQQARRGVEPAGSGWLWVDASRWIALDIKAAVDVQDMPGDELGIVGTEVRHRTGDVGRLPDAPEGIVGHHGRKASGVMAAVIGGFDESGSDPVTVVP